MSQTAQPIAPLPDVSIIIVNWNTCDLLRDCLESLKRIDPCPAFEICVVDNASTDGSVDTVRSHYPDVRLIANTLNAGFAAANNRGAASARGRYLLLLNPDTVVLPNSLAELVRFADAHPDAGAVGPRLLNSDGSPQRSCWRGRPGITSALVDGLYLWKLPGAPLASRFEIDPGAVQESIEVKHILGACMLIRRAAWDRVGPLDEGFFMYLEETDWCVRATEAGWKIMFNPASVITHHGQQSSHRHPTGGAVYFYRSLCRFVRKHHPGRKGLGRTRIAVLKAIIGGTCVLRIGLWKTRRWLSRGRHSAALCDRMTKGYLDVLRRLPSL